MRPYVVLSLAALLTTAGLLMNVRGNCRTHLGSRRGTLVILSYCRDGIAVGADSGAFSPELDQVFSRQKIFQAGKFSVVGFVGTTSLLMVGDTDQRKNIVIYEENLLAGAKELLDGLPGTASPTQAHAEVTRLVQKAIERFFVNSWVVRPNTSPNHIVGVVTTGYEGGQIVLLITDFYRPVSSPLAVGRQDATRQVVAGKFALIPFALKKTCGELLDGNNPVLERWRRLGIVRLYRQRKSQNRLDDFTLTEIVNLVRACLDITERSGKLVDPEAYQVRPPNRIATITPDEGFRWVAAGSR